MSLDGVGCKDCKRVREHVFSLLPFKVLEATSGKSLCIRGVAMCTGMSRNRNLKNFVFWNICLRVQPQLDCKL